MCGRYTLIILMEELAAYFYAFPVTAAFGPRYNIAPGQMIPVVIAREGRNRIGLVQWGLVPSWAREGSPSSPLINARAETLASKPSFRTLFQRKRCLIPADSFYEWQKQGGSKQPYRIMLRSGSIFAMAGLYDTWVSPSGDKLSTCTIITTEANELMQGIHSRMPVILRQEDEALWLSSAESHPAALQPLLTPYPSIEMTAYPVDPFVGNAKNDSPDCIKRLSFPDGG